MRFEEAVDDLEDGDLVEERELLDAVDDALGRRILTRARRDGAAKPDTSNVLCQGTSAGCGSYVERTQWDGAQIVAEWRTAETTPTGMISGAVSYVYLDRLDQLIGLVTDTARVVQYTWRGLAEGTVFVDGTPGDCSIFTTGCLRVEWPAASQGAVYYTPNLLDNSQGPSTSDRWFGTLLANGQGTTGQVFRRNRFFDPASGQFTQEDPIGLGGGLNLWGIAGGDPVNFSDPFGLCPVCLFGAVWAAYEVASSAYDFYQAGRTLLNREATTGQKATSVALAAIGVLAPGGGYSLLDDLANAAKVVGRGGLTAAGRSLTKHAVGQRAASRAFPRLAGDASAISAAAQNIVEEILTHPGTTSSVIRSGRFKGGMEYLDPTGRGIRFDAQKRFVGFVERE